MVCVADEAKLGTGREGINLKMVTIWDWTRILRLVSLELFNKTKTDWTHQVYKVLDVCPVRRLLFGLDLDSRC